MDMVSLIKSYDTVEDVELIESYFQLNDLEKDAAFHRKLEIMYQGLDDELRVRDRGVNPDLFNGWSKQERDKFDLDWDDDTFVEHLSLDPPQSPVPMSYINQEGTGKRTRDNDVASTSKRQKPIEYFTIKTGKEVNVRKFRTTGTFCSSIVS